MPLLSTQPTIIPIVANFADLARWICEPLDAAYCISAVEHMDVTDIISGFNALRHLLRPEAPFILTLRQP